MISFYVDRGGTFTDIVAVTDEQKIINNLPQENPIFTVIPTSNHQWIILYKLLSENPENYPDAVIQGIRDILAVASHTPIPCEQIQVLKMGTTVATNALLERNGDRVVLVLTKGFKDALRIGYQNRPNIFARQIILPQMLYEKVIEVEERYDKNGNELKPVNATELTAELKVAYDQGIRSCAIVFMHSYRYPKHEQQAREIAQEIGFSYIAVSHEISPLMKLVARGDTTVVDAYLSPILRRYVSQVASQLPGVRLMFMQSNGGLADADKFLGKDAIISGPAGGIVGAAETSKRAGFKKIIAFDMGGTSTDVSHYNGEYERQSETEIAGVRIQTPMMAIHTVAAGGGSLLIFDGFRYRVGPESAGANPGPACYRRGGPLTVTDANVMLGKIQPQYFPHLFGVEGNLPLDGEIVQRKFSQLTEQIKDNRTPEQVAEGFIRIAVENMANAIKKISLQRGYDVSQYTLCCFGGAGGQHACLIADTLGITTIFLHPYAGVLSAYGMGLADIRVIKRATVEKCLDDNLLPELKQLMTSLEVQCRKELNPHEKIRAEQVIPKVDLKYQGSDASLPIDFVPDVSLLREKFESKHKLRYGFIQSQRDLIVESASVETVQLMATPSEPILKRCRPLGQLPQPLEVVKIFTADSWHDAPVYQREDLQPDDLIPSPAIIVEKISTIVVEPHWQATLTAKNHLILKRCDM